MSLCVHCDKPNPCACYESFGDPRPVKIDWENVILIGLTVFAIVALAVLPYVTR